MLPDDQLRVFLTIFLSIPLSYLLRYLTGPNKTYFSLVCSLLLQVFVYGNEMWIPFAMHFMIYGAIKVRGRNSGLLVTFLGMLLLSIYHGYRMAVDYGSWTLDVSTILMGNVCKYSLFAYEYQDGGQPNSQLTAEQR